MKSSFTYVQTNNSTREDNSRYQTTTEEISKGNKTGYVDGMNLCAFHVTSFVFYCKFDYNILKFKLLEHANICKTNWLNGFKIVFACCQLPIMFAYANFRIWTQKRARLRLSTNNKLIFYNFILIETLWFSPRRHFSKVKV